MDETARQALEKALEHRFDDPGLLELALTHPSRSQEVDRTRGNERLEFLGDAALDLAVARLLYECHPDWSEGALTRTRSALVNTRSLARQARVLELGAHVRLGRTEVRTGGEEKHTILANVFEATAGALYLDGGLEAVVRLARRLFADTLAVDAEPIRGDPKTRLQEWAHACQAPAPRYIVDDRGNENDEDRFEAEVRVGEEALGRGRGRTKQGAQQAAAAAALDRVEPAGT